MDKKVVVIGLILVIILAALIYFIAKPKQYYLENPQDWIEAKPAGVKEIDIAKATRGAGFLSPEGLQYSDGKVLTAFGYDGAYEGVYFTANKYVDILSGNTLLSMGPEMNPSDGVMEGFIAEYIKDNEVIAYIFVDEDWKQKLGQSTSIFWGKKLQNNKNFEFTPVADGVYIDTIIDDPERFKSGYTERYGGIVVGNIDQNNVLYDSFEGKTFIRLV